MPTTKGKVYLGEQLICHTLTDIETETLAFEQMNASNLPYCSSKAPTSLRPVQPGYCLTFNGTTHRIDAAHLAGTETVVSSQGTSTPSVSAGQIDFTAGTSNNIILSDGTQYNLNESTGTVAIDSSGNNNDGTLVNGPTWTTDNSLPYSWLNQVGYSQRMYFDGVDDYVALDAQIVITDSATIEADFVIGTVGAQGMVVSKGGAAPNGYVIGVDASGGVYSRVGNLVLTSLVNYASGDVIEAKVVVTTGGTELFVGGVSQGTNAAIGVDNAHGTHFGRQSNSASYFSGVISRVKIITPTTEGEWNSNGNTAADWLDTVGSNNGTLNGSPSNIYIPRDEATPANDAFGNALQWSGSAFPRRPEYRGSYAVTFDGVNDYIAFPLGTFNTSAFSVKAEVMLTSMAANTDVFSQAAGTGTGRAWVRVATDGSVVTFLGGAGSTTLAPAGTITVSTVCEIELIYTLSPDTLTLVVDGVSQTPVTRTVEESTGDFYIGVGHTASTNRLTGDVYSATLNGSGYTFAEGVGATAHDISGNGNDGTITNASTATEGAGFWAGRIDGEANAHNINNGYSFGQQLSITDTYNDATSESFAVGDSLETELTIDGLTVYANLCSFNTTVLSNYISFDGGGSSPTTAPRITIKTDQGTTGVASLSVPSIIGGIKTFKIRRTSTDVIASIDGVDYGSVTVPSTDTFTGISINVSASVRYITGVLHAVKYNGIRLPLPVRFPADSAAPTLDVYGSTLTNPAVANSHNDAETTWDVYNIGTGDVPCPESNSNSGLSAIAFDADLTADDSAYMHLATSVLNDRLIAFSADLTGGDKTLAEKYTE